MGTFIREWRLKETMKPECFCVRLGKQWKVMGKCDGTRVWTQGSEPRWGCLFRSLLWSGIPSSWGCGRFCPPGMGGGPHHRRAFGPASGDAQRVLLTPAFTWTGSMGHRVQSGVWIPTHCSSFFHQEEVKCGLRHTDVLSGTIWKSLDSWLAGADWWSSLGKGAPGD